MGPRCSLGYSDWSPQHRSVDRTGSRLDQLGVSHKGKPFAQAGRLAWHHQPLSPRNGWMLPDRHCLKRGGKAAPWVSRCRLCGVSSPTWSCSGVMLKASCNSCSR